MSFVYRSNSPEFLNYVAYSKTRNDIINDPRLCVLLEDPDIKENMELALLYREAQYGNYESKKTFVGYFLANGPELDTDTIMYYREKILHNKTYTDIYRTEFSDISIVDDLRINVYGKDTTDTNELLSCLSNPCDYLGPFSSSIGLMGDAKNFNTLGNVFARLNDKTNENEEDSTRVWGNIPQHMFSKLIPDLGKAYRVMMASMSASMNTFNKKIKSAGLTKETKVFGDPKAEDMANDVSSAIKVNITSNLGDCARIWESMRRLRVYDPSVNAKQPFESVSNKTPDGNPAPNYTPVTDAALAPHPIKTKDASSGITNVKTEKIRGKKLSDLDNRYKQTYSVYRYLLNNKKDKIDAIDIQTMEEFIADIDYYLQDVSGESELPSIGGLTQNYQMLEAGWKYDIN